SGDRTSPASLYREVRLLAVPGDRLALVLRDPRPAIRDLQILSN
ncbi:MAG: hypothetical protein ACI9NT_000487, partial [Bacteroidia bacterium]